MLQKPFTEKNEFELFFKEYFNPLVNFVNKYLNNYENSKEVVQSTFVKIWLYRNQIEVKSSTKAYLYQMTKNMMIDYIRQKQKFVSSEWNDKQIQIIEDSTIEHLDPYLVRQAIELAMVGLKDKSREIFRLNKFEGLTYSEIAVFLNISERTVEDNIARVSKLLKEKLQNHPYFFD